MNVAKRDQKRSKQSKPKKVSDQPAGPEAKNVKGGSLNLVRTAGAPEHGGGPTAFPTETIKMTYDSIEWTN